MSKKKHVFEIEVTSMTETDDPTKKFVEFILHDFEISHNSTRIKEEVAIPALPSLKGMPIVLKYHKVSEAGANDDALGGHEVVIVEDREGELDIRTDTIAIGSFTDEATIVEVLVDGVNKKVVKGNGVLWASRYPDIIALLQEWWDAGIPIKSSMEILFDEYSVKDGVLDVENYVYEGHCILNSEERNGHKIVNPAYDSSQITKFQKLVAQALGKEGEDEEMYRKYFELSHGDIRSLLDSAMKADMAEQDYWDSWITAVYDDKFVYNLWTSGSTKYYVVNYVKSENEVTVDWDSKQEVFKKEEWIPVATEIQSLQAERNEYKEKLEEAEKQLNQFAEKQFEENVEKQKEFYSAKFEAFGEKEKFESEEVQSLVVNSAKSGKEADEATVKLSKMLLEMLDPSKINKVKERGIFQYASDSKIDNLGGSSFRERYAE